MKSFFYFSLILLLNVHSFGIDSLQLRLDQGETPKEIIESGVPKDSLYGKIYQGGYIFYFFPGDSTGMVFGQEDLHYPHDTTNQKIIWNCRVRNTGAKSRKIGDGLNNSKKI